MRAYKVFDGNWCCRGFQYEVGKSYHEEGIEICMRGFHACRRLNDCFSYYDFDRHNRVAEVELSGEIQEGEIQEGSKVCASDITILREMTWEEVLEQCNCGKGNTGRLNCGDYNDGNCNCGDGNGGHWNSGNGNRGNWNSGGDNDGNRNSGDFNSGDVNSGRHNSGDRNSGDGNSGRHNSGDWNSGDWNSGDGNSGNWNSGRWNSCSHSSGFFCTEEPKVVMFNRETDVKRGDIDFPPFLDFSLVRNGKVVPYKEAFKTAWDGAQPWEREQVKALPNFDAEIFYQISGIDLRGER